MGSKMWADEGTSAPTGCGGKSKDGRTSASIDLSVICYANATSPYEGEASRCGGGCGEWKNSCKLYKWCFTFKR